MAKAEKAGKQKSIKGKQRRNQRKTRSSVLPNRTPAGQVGFFWPTGDSIIGQSEKGAMRSWAFHGNRTMHAGFEAFCSKNVFC